MTAIVIRPGETSDRTFVRDLGARTVAASVSSLRPASDGVLRASYARLLDFAFANSHVLVVAQSDLDGPLGFALLLDDLPDEVTGLPQGFIAYMAVEPDARRQGIGAKLLAAAEDAARRCGRSYIALMVTEDNLPARELYAAAGYATERRLLCKAL